MRVGRDTNYGKKSLMTPAFVRIRKRIGKNDGLNLPLRALKIWRALIIRGDFSKGDSLVRASIFRAPRERRRFSFRISFNGDPPMRRDTFAELISLVHPIIKHGFAVSAAIANRAHVSTSISLAVRYCAIHIETPKSD